MFQSYRECKIKRLYETTCTKKMAAPLQSVSLNRKRPRSKALNTTQEEDSGGKKTKESPFSEIEFKYYLKESETIYLGK